MIRLHLACLTLLCAFCPMVLASDYVEVSVDPQSVTLVGRDARWSLLVQGRQADGRWVDLTREAHYLSMAPAVAEVAAQGELRALTDGATTIQVQVAGQTLTVGCQVERAGVPRKFNFENDIEPLLGKFGCNSSGCHGKAEGQNGFKLSVFGFDPPADYRALTMEDRGRRVFPAAADRSLLLRKAGGLAPHGGGVRIAPDSREFQILRDWIAGGLRFGDKDDPQVVRIEVTPRERLLAMRGGQQLRAVATYTDGQRVDVTRLTRFVSNNDALVTVNEFGLVAAGETPGQAAIMASFMGAVDLFQAIIPQPSVNVPPLQLAEINFIDGLVYKHLAKLNIAPSGPADDAEFLRRVYLDCIGMLPTAAEARTFLADTRPDRRAALVDSLLNRPEFADYWALKWSDLLRVDRVALGHKGAYAYYRWIRESLLQNKPYDQFARELILAEGPLAEAPAAHFYKVTPRPGDMASTLSQVLLGVRIACAECHHHPYDRWSQTDYFGMVDYFAPLTRKTAPQGEILLAAGNPETRHPRTSARILAHPLGAPEPTEPLAAGDRRAGLAAWLTAPENPWFSRNLANRTWAHFLGRGLVEPVDDMRATNPPSNPELLDAIGRYLVEQRYDMRQLIRVITSSQVYQLSSQPNESNHRDEQNYSRALLKRLDAEVLLDAICQTSGVGEKFMGVPSGYRAVQLWDSGVPHYFLKLFGRPVRQTACECERNAEASVAQVLHFLNSPEIQAKLSHDGGQIRRLEAELRDHGELVDALYLTFYSRFPTGDERELGITHLNGAVDNRRKAAEDLAWSMLNSLEFIFNH